METLTRSHSQGVDNKGGRGLQHEKKKKPLRSFKPILESERPATPEPEWTIPPNDFPEPEHNWANAYATTYKVPEENKLDTKCRLVPSCFVIFDLEPLSLSLDFVFSVRDL
ncbi:hypothetical protein Tco_0909591 [Tanacetum coccineum]|uniref:Uncharacterized protein n=1 Tax=Tanacetum coccineum TaxID=301880 RepID=A0ABQ5CQE6_9ASTR